MKKLFLALLVIAATMNVMAVETARVRLKLNSANNQLCFVTLVQNDEATEGAATGSAEMNMAGRQVAFYAINGSYNYEIYLTKSLGALPFGLKTNGETNYTLTVVSASGETLTMKDETADATFVLTDGATYNFTENSTNSTINNRFHLYITPAAPGICHYGNVLKVTGSNGMVVKVHNMDDTDAMADVTITSDDQDIDISALTADTQYKVVWNSQTLIIRK